MLRPQSRDQLRFGLEADWRVPLALVALGAFSLAIDLPLRQWVNAGGAPKWLIKTCSLSEVFAHGLGIGMIAVAVWTLDRERRVTVARLLAAALGAGLCANLVKLLLARVRPGHLDAVGSVWGTFGPWLPLGRGGHALQSFPSSHAATAAGLAVALAWLYPHGRRLFFTLAVLAALQRVLAGAHFASDVLLGGAVGCAWARSLVGQSWLARLFERWETRWSARANVASQSVSVVGPEHAVARPTIAPPPLPLREAG